MTFDELKPDKQIRLEWRGRIVVVVVVVVVVLFLFLFFCYCYYGKKGRRREGGGE